MKVDIPKIETLAGQVALEEMVELVDLRVMPEGPRVMVRVFVDREGGINLRDCEAFSRKMSALLDVEDPVDGPYVLEVSSPGIDRRLARPAHFAAVRGRRVRAALSEAVDGCRNVAGTLVSSDDREIVVDRGDRTFRIPYALIRKAKLDVSDEELFGKGKKKP
ncbi:MAG: ribosome maturation factor RimP [Deltaproteobacteria bacterium]|nr:ribosome maturation factor RimP [Deltaproteobacteria bacterium]